MAEAPGFTFTAEERYRLLVAIGARGPRRLDPRPHAARRLGHRARGAHRPRLRLPGPEPGRAVRRGRQARPGGIAPPGRRGRPGFWTSRKFTRSRHEVFSLVSCKPLISRARPVGTGREESPGGRERDVADRDPDRDPCRRHLPTG